MNFCNFYNLGVKIGHGSYSEVYKCVQKNTAECNVSPSTSSHSDIEGSNSDCAVKIFFNRDEGLNELDIIKKIQNHKSIIKLIEFFDNGENIFMVLECIPFTLYNTFTLITPSIINYI